MLQLLDMMECQCMSMILRYRVWIKFMKMNKKIKKIEVQRVVALIQIKKLQLMIKMQESILNRKFQTPLRGIRWILMKLHRFD